MHAGIRHAEDSHEPAFSTVRPTSSTWVPQGLGAHMSWRSLSRILTGASNSNSLPYSLRRYGTVTGVNTRPAKMKYDGGWPLRSPEARLQDPMSERRSCRAHTASYGPHAGPVRHHRDATSHKARHPCKPSITSTARGWPKAICLRRNDTARHNVSIAAQKLAR